MYEEAVIHQEIETRIRIRMTALTAAETLVVVRMLLDVQEVFDILT